ncbi:hypothetical protein [Nocardioides sp. zg-1228]|uniref:hypothetical protein n=1 Tax=Nocardioides sp. zg-1228 TaxID=2763008 RepID=UPI001642B4FF|nr:hypothetical protein [Nocardioides sp. zg-1228]MBC2933046.1 hypothetical protein [Nocardioides sp. zg-1228]QSF56760.1 hypothetical protein JX575_14280 [Nocardioides sp. zg-1228]
MTHELLPDRWNDRDFPALLAAARILESDSPEDADTQLEEFQEAAGLSERELVRALIGLEQAGYIETQGSAPLAGDPTIWVTGLTERGRRKTGLWPDEESSADALVDLLAQAAERVGDEDDAGALRKAGRLLRGVPSEVLADITAALIRQQVGI